MTDIEIAQGTRRKAGLLPRKGLPFANLKALQDYSGGLDIRAAVK